MSRLSLLNSTILAAALAGAGAAAAQDSATAAADDAFGERIGVEQVGLYGEGEVRGFNLGNSGAYRIDGAYFVRAINLSDSSLDGVAVRVGVNAARLDYPAPSGVVNYRLRAVGTQPYLQVSAGIRDYDASPFLDVRGTAVTDDGRLGLSANLIHRPGVTWAQGNSGDINELGLVGRWTPSPALNARAFLSYVDRRYNGDYGVLPTERTAPAPMLPVVSYSPRWGLVEADQFNYGVLADARLGGWRLDASVFRSDYDLDRSDFTLLSVDAEGVGQASLRSTPSRRFLSDTAEARLSRVFERGAFDHRLSASVRGRRSRVLNAPSRPFALGPVDLYTPPDYPDAPAFADDGRRIHDDVDQLVASLGYGLVWNDRLEVRLGAHRSRYEKRVTPIGGTVNARVEDSWLYNASAVFAVTDRTSLFASWVTGLEETGSAPHTATNALEVLAPVEAEQRELGVRHAVRDGLQLIIAGFDVSKPTVGFRSDGRFDLVGEVRHRGVEASLTGRLAEGTNVVLGAVWLQPTVTGELVDQGVVGETPPGLSRLVAVASVDHRLAFAPAWTVDASVSHHGEREADTRNTWTLPPVTTVGVGVRYGFRIGETPATLRVAVSNLFDERGWWASPEELIWPIGARTVRASLTLRFD